MSCAYRNRILAAGGVNYHIDSGGTSHAIVNDAVRNCIAVRAGTGPPADVHTSPVNEYPPGAPAYCPYQTDVGLNFIYEGPDPTVWVVRQTASGLVKYHAGGFCVPDPLTTQLKRYRLFRVPAGETAGIPQGDDWFPSAQACSDLPGAGLEER